MNYRYIVTEETNPYRNLAMEQALFSYMEPQTVMLFLWQNDHTIVIGRNQDVYSECRVEAFLEDGGTIARRRSGGGAVYHDLGNLNFSILCSAADIDRHPYQELVKKALDLFGIAAEFNGRNDLVCKEKKFSGNAVYTDGEAVCQHGTLLIDSDIEKMSYYLTPDQSKLNRNHVKSVESRVANLREFSKEITVSRMRQAMIDAAGAQPFDENLQEKAIRELEQFYSDRDWIYGGKL